MTQDLDQLYTVWMDAERDEQAALLLHQAHDSIESLALYERAVEKVEGAKGAYEAALAAADRRTAARPHSEIAAAI